MNGEMMTANTQSMRNAAADVANQKKTVYDQLTREIDNLITNVLGQSWVDEAYDQMKQEYTSKSKPKLEELGILLMDFVSCMDVAADDLDTAIKSLL